MLPRQGSCCSPWAQSHVNVSNTRRAVQDAERIISVSLPTSLSLSTLPTVTSIAPTAILWGRLISRQSAGCLAIRGSPWSWKSC
uniref:Uncharacterized protein n=1 Tax=Pavo cristatus TaxID=9049 RepID=A0A8C9FSG9_PAVCR